MPSQDAVTTAAEGRPAARLSYTVKPSVVSGAAHGRPETARKAV